MLKILLSIVPTLFIYLILPTISARANHILSLESLPDGNYYYRGETSPYTNDALKVLLTKRKNLVTGVGIAFFSENHCFQGHARENSIVEVLLGIPNLSRGERIRWEFKPINSSIKLDGYNRVLSYNSAPDSAQRLHQECIKIYTSY